MHIHTHIDNAILSIVKQTTGNNSLWCLSRPLAVWGHRGWDNGGTRGGAGAAAEARGGTWDSRRAVVAHMWGGGWWQLAWGRRWMAGVTVRDSF